MRGFDFKASWDALAPRFSELVPVDGGPLRRLVLYPYVLDWLQNFSRRAAVVDIGCGSGSLSLQLAAEGWPTTGLDFSEEMIRIARTRAGSKAMVEFVRADVKDPQLGRRFDLGVSLFTMQDCDDLDGFFAGVRTLLRRGGRMLSVVESRAALIDGALPSTLPKRVLAGEGDERLVEVDWGGLTTRTYWRSRSRVCEAAARTGFAVLTRQELSDLEGEPKYLAYDIAAAP